MNPFAIVGLIGLLFFSLYGAFTVTRPKTIAQYLAAAALGSLCFQGFVALLLYLR